MKTRMQPIGNIWSKFPRVVRDLAVQCGKKVRIEMEGRETELDKTIVEAIKDPLTHLIRNAIDHGIEPPDARLAQRKPSEGCLLLRAFHEGGQVNIEIVDDGVGLNLERIRQKAVDRGLLTPDQALRINDRDTAQFIFAPGFSTAAQITNMSGRGVGMDVVKTNVERIGGTVDIESRPRRGTTVRLKIPLTLAIIPALIITSDGDRYAIPQVSLVELVRLDGKQARQGIERLHGVPVFRLRGQLLPIVDLRQELRRASGGCGVPSGSAGGAPAWGDEATRNLVVLRASDRLFGLIVDSISDTAEIVVKPLGKQLKGIPVYAGATILGDGKVALILDVVGIARRARVVSDDRDRSPPQLNLRKSECRGDRQQLLIVHVGDRRIALPISKVSRLEEIPGTQVELADDREVVQYRGQILPLIRLGDVLGITTRSDPERTLQVVVYQEQEQSVGLIVDRVADVVESSVHIQRRSQSNHLLGSAVIQGRVTELLNLPEVIRHIEPVSLEQQLA
jgi:two-component system chemotaxis sensor kinase CheA